MAESTKEATDEGAKVTTTVEGSGEGYDGGEGGRGAHGANTHTVMVSMAVLPVHSGSCPTTSLTVLSPARSGKVTLEDSLQPEEDLDQNNFWLSVSAAA